MLIVHMQCHSCHAMFRWCSYYVACTSCEPNCTQGEVVTMHELIDITKPYHTINVYAPPSTIDWAELRDLGITHVHSDSDPHAVYTANSSTGKFDRRPSRK
jgi:hypothetical protein